MAPVPGQGLAEDAAQLGVQALRLYPDRLQQRANHDVGMPLAGKLSTGLCEQRVQPWAPLHPGEDDLGIWEHERRRLDRIALGRQEALCRTEALKAVRVAGREGRKHALHPCVQVQRLLWSDGGERESVLTERERHS